MKKKLTALALGIALLTVNGLSEAATITLTSSADTYVNMSTPLLNHGTELTMTTGHHGDDYAALLKFDLSALPSSAVINSAVMNLNWTGRTYTQQDLYWYQDPPGSGNWVSSGEYLYPWAPEFLVHKVNTSWSEYNVAFTDIFQDNVNPVWPNVPIVKDDFFDSDVIANFFYTDPNISQSLINLDITSQANLWHGGEENNGLIFTSTGWVLSSFFIATREWDDYAPTLTIEYTSDDHPVPEPSTALLLGIGLAGTAYAGRRMRKVQI